MNLPSSAAQTFLGWRVVAGAFVLAVFGWGLGFYGPPVYLHAVSAARGWPVALVSAAVTTHYFCGALVVAQLPRLYARFGLRTVTRAGAAALALGLMGWASATAPWQLFAATALTGCGWVTMGAAAINAIVSPWFVRLRPKALSTAYNGASVGGIIFSPLWVLLIGAIGFQTAAALIGGLTLVVVAGLTAGAIGRRPEDFGQSSDGDGAAVAAAMSPDPTATLPGSALWRDWRFRTLAAGMALGLFAQIGLLAHLFSLIAPRLGDGAAGLVAGLATASAIAGRTAFGWLMPAGADRRRAAAASYGLQIAGAGLLAASASSGPLPIVLGVLLFGFGIGNATSLPPLIAQTEFAKADTGRVVALVVALAQAVYAFAPATFGLVRQLVQGLGPDAELIAVCTLAIAVKVLAITALLSGGWGRSLPSARGT
jgi:hypothetical protein